MKLWRRLNSQGDGLVVTVVRREKRTFSGVEQEFYIAKGAQSFSGCMGRESTYFIPVDKAEIIDDGSEK